MKQTHDDIVNLFIAKRAPKFHMNGMSAIGITQKQYKWLEDVYSRTTGDYEGDPKGEITIDGKTVYWWVNHRAHTVIKMKLM